MEMHFLINYSNMSMYDGIDMYYNMVCLTCVITTYFFYYI